MRKPGPPFLALPDYQRIYQVAFSVLQTSGVAVTHRACLFFACAGALIMRDHYGMKATISGGGLALMVDAARKNVLVFARPDSSGWTADTSAFHVWNECNGWLIDFMAPIYGHSAKEDGAGFFVPARMMQKKLITTCEHPEALGQSGDIWCRHDPDLVNELIDAQPALFGDLLSTCSAWFRRPPRALAQLALADSQGPAKKLELRAPAIVGAW